MLKKQYYVAPAAEVILMKFDRNFMETNPDDTTKPYITEQDPIFGN